MEASQHHTPESSPRPFNKNIVCSLIEVTSFRTPSFKEDTYFITHLKHSQRKALQELKDQACHGPDSMWGVPLFGSQDERTYFILLKFLRARDFRVPDVLTMLLKCLVWRKDFGADGILVEELRSFKELEGVVAFVRGYDGEGHPACYNVYGIFKDKEMYDKILGDDEMLKKFLRWRVQVLERGIKLLNFKPGGVKSIIQVTDLKDTPKRKLRVVSNHILSLFQYRQMVARKIFINVPWYFSLLYSMFSPFLTQRSKTKFVIAKEGKCC